MKLFEVLYEYSVTAESAKSAMWEINADKGSVRLTPQSADPDATRWAAQPEFTFGIDRFTTELKSAKSSNQKSTLANELCRWIANAAVEAFEREAVDIEYSWFNQEDHPFSFSYALVRGKQTGKPTLLWSNTEKVAPPRALWVPFFYVVCKI